jgi:hypothetical protein
MTLISLPLRCAPPDASKRCQTQAEQAEGGGLGYRSCFLNRQRSRRIPIKRAKLDGEEASRRISGGKHTDAQRRHDVRSEEEAVDVRAEVIATSRRVEYRDCGKGVETV